MARRRAGPSRRTSASVDTRTACTRALRPLPVAPHLIAHVPPTARASRRFLRGVAHGVLPQAVNAPDASRPGLEVRRRAARGRQGGWWRRSLTRHLRGRPTNAPGRPLALPIGQVRSRTIAPMATDLDDAWGELHDATPDGWFVGRPSCDEGRGVWEQHAFDAQEGTGPGCAGFDHYVPFVPPGGTGAATLQAVQAVVGVVVSGGGDARAARRWTARPGRSVSGRCRPRG